MSIEKKNPSINRATIFVIFASALAGCLYGLDIGAIGGALRFIQKEMNLTAVQQGWIVGAVLYGGAIAILIAGALADWFGRKKMIVLSAIIFILGVFLSVCAKDYHLLLCARLIMGIGVGVSAILIPLYISETAPSYIRGRAVACFQLFLTGGICLAYLIDLAFQSTGNWRAMFGVLAIPGVIFFIGTIFLPESPRWFFMKKRIDDAKKSLLKFNSESRVQKLIEEMQALEADKQRKVAAGGNSSIFRKAYLVPFIIAFLIANLNQTTGINCVLQYAPTIFEQSGVHSPVLSVLLGTGVTFINFVITIIAISLIDKLGRKPLLVFSTAGVVVCLCILGIASLLGVSDFKVLLLAIGMFGFIISFAIGCGVVVWLAMSELLPQAIRSKGLAICLFGNSMLSSILATLFLVIREQIGFSGLFFMLAGFSLIYFIVAAFLLPETKGKTVEEVEEFWIKKYE